MYILWSNWVQKHQRKFLGMLLHFAQSISKIQRKFQKIQRKNVKVSILPFWALKPIQNVFNGISLHSWGPDASFDTHIALFIYDMCRLAYLSNRAFLSFVITTCVKICHNCQLWHIMTHKDMTYEKNFIYQYGCQKKRQDLSDTETKGKLLLKRN